MNYDIILLEEKIVAGYMVKTTNENNKAMTDIGETWGRFIQNEAYNSITDRINEKCIGLYTDYEGDFTKPYNFVAGCEVLHSKAIPAGMVVKKIPGGSYARFIIKGDVRNAVGEFWSKLWEMPLDRKYSADFEEYQNDSQDMNNQEIHIYIALNS
jgi:predicted transcriptional regulator YdeE